MSGEIDGREMGGNLKEQGAETEKMHNRVSANLLRHIALEIIVVEGQPRQCGQTSQLRGECPPIA